MSLLTVFQSGDKRWTAFEAAITIHPASETAMLKEGGCSKCFVWLSVLSFFSFRELRGGGGEAERGRRVGPRCFYVLFHTANFETAVLLDLKEGF